MKTFEKLCLKACGYTVLLMCCFYLFAAIANLEGQYMPVSRFLTLLLYGFIISLAELIYNVLNLKKWQRGALHYVILLSSFLIVFIISGNLVIKGPASVFSAIILFTVAYFALWLLAFSSCFSSCAPS